MIGGGPAGLAAAEVLLAHGVRVLLVDQKPSLARKFMMAGKSGLNLAKDEPLEALQAAVNCPELNPILAEFDSQAVKAWAQGLGQEVFTGSSGRVFPVAMKASPLLRAWRARLAAIEVRTRWRWVGFEGDAQRFDTPDGPRVIRAKATVFAPGGKSWARLGADGAWAGAFADQALPLAPFEPANIGVSVPWSSHMERYFGAPIKTVALSCGGRRETGEFVISRRGLEGSLIYALSPQIRTGAPLILHAKPGMNEAQVIERLRARPAKETLSNTLRKALGIAGPLAALLQEFGRPLRYDFTKKIIALQMIHAGPRDIDEAISVAGGLRWDALDAQLMLRAKPGVFCAGEMLDWEAPTGGYLITTCLATGRWAGRAAADWVAR